MATTATAAVVQQEANNEGKRVKTIILPSPATSASSPLVIASATTTTMPVTSTTNLKFVCDICGFLCSDLDNLKAHLSVHNEKNEQRTVIKMAAAATAQTSTTAPAGAHGHGKISSILKLQSAVLPSNHHHHHHSTTAVINLPQSMTVLNLKEVSSKLQSQEQPHSDKAPAEQENGVAATKTSDLNKISCSSASLSDYSLSNSPISSMSSSSSLASGLSLFSPAAAGASNSSPTHLSLPYHYSESENIYLCNLCNCNYDSLRSIKAHLWKHSGHHELSYPTSSLESTIKPKIHQASNFIQNENLINSSAANFKRHVTLQLPASTKNKLQSSLNFKSRPDDQYQVQSSQGGQLFDASNYSSSASYMSWNHWSELTNGGGQNKEDGRGGSAETEMTQSGESNGLSGAADGVNNVGPRRSSGGGICSVLLEVVEKLHDEEELHQNDENHMATLMSASREGSADSLNASSNGVNLNNEKPAKKRTSRRTTGKTRHIRDLLNQQQEIAEESTNRETYAELSPPPIEVAKSTTTATTATSSKKKRKDWPSSSRKPTNDSTADSSSSPINESNTTPDSGLTANDVNSKKMKLSPAVAASRNPTKQQLDSRKKVALSRRDENECEIETTIVTSIYEDVAAVIQNEDDDDNDDNDNNDYQKMDQTGLNLLVRSYLLAQLSKAN